MLDALIRDYFSLPILSPFEYFLMSVNPRLYTMEYVHVHSNVLLFSFLCIILMIVVFVATFYEILFLSYCYTISLFLLFVQLQGCINSASLFSGHHKQATRLSYTQMRNLVGMSLPGSLLLFL